MTNGDKDFFFRKKTGGTNFGHQEQARLATRRDERPVPPGVDLAALPRSLGGDKQHQDASDCHLGLLTPV